jgi:large subunit ribosomal protein L10
MSKYVKNLIAEDLREQFRGVDDALLVNMVGLDANADNRLRGALLEKNIRVLVVKNSLAARATEGTPLGIMFEGLTGNSAVCWGSDDIVALAKEVTALAKDKQFEAFTTRGGVMDGDMLSAEQVAEVSKWPTREGVLSQIVGQIIGPGASLAALLGGPGSLVASQIASLAGDEEEEETSAEESTAEETPAAEEAKAEETPAAEAPAEEAKAEETPAEEAPAEEAKAEETPAAEAPAEEAPAEEAPAEEKPAEEEGKAADA